MSTAHVCPSCTQINPTEAVVCLACGVELPVASRGPATDSDLVIDLTRFETEEETVPSVHLDAPELQRWLDSGPDGLDSADTPLDLTLRSIDELPVLEDVAPEASTLPPGVVLRSDGELAAGKPSVAKVARRAAVRRSRQSSHQAALGTVFAPTDVLVLERNDLAREQLCSLLESFGFRAHPAQTPLQAVRLLDAKHFAAVFLDVAFDGPEQRISVDLCQRIKAEVPHSTGCASALIIVSGSSRQVERVRATLAGSDEFLSKPVTRGSIAQALEACNVVLPADSRRR
ncbi:MAG: response regulator [Burkholderiaceae bacterium]|nr:response regulator [Burkholderiaceae bacterium]